jgi:MFS transporter, SHS family, lactate transporter
MACLWMASGFVIYYSVYGMFATRLQKDLHLAAGMVAMPIALANLVILQGAFLGAIYGQNPAYLTERFPTEVRATASSFCYHQGAIWAGFTGPVLTYFAVSQPTGFAVPMLIATTGAAIMFVITLLYSPETKGKELISQITLLQPAE